MYQNWFFSKVGTLYLHIKHLIPTTYVKIRQEFGPPIFGTITKDDCFYDATTEKKIMVIEFFLPVIHPSSFLLKSIFFF